MRAGYSEPGPGLRPRTAEGLESRRKPPGFRRFGRLALARTGHGSFVRAHPCAPPTHPPSQPTHPPVPVRLLFAFASFRGRLGLSRRAPPSGGSRLVALGSALAHGPRGSGAAAESGEAAAPALSSESRAALSPPRPPPARFGYRLCGAGGWGGGGGSGSRCGLCCRVSSSFDPCAPPFRAVIVSNPYMNSYVMNSFHVIYEFI